MLIAVDEEVLEGFEIERKWRNHINNSNMLVMHKDKQALKEKLDIAVNAMKLARDTAYSSTQDCPKCSFIDEKLSEALAKIKEIK